MDIPTDALRSINLEHIMLALMVFYVGYIQLLLPWRKAYSEKQAKYAGLTSRCESLEARATNLERQVSERVHKGDFESTQREREAALGNIEKGFDRIEGRFDKLEVRIEDLDSTLGLQMRAFEGRMATVETRQEDK